MVFKQKLKRPRKRGGCKRTSFCVNKKRQFLRYMGGLQAKSACKPWGVIRGGLFNSVHLMDRSTLVFNDLISFLNVLQMFLYFDFLGIYLRNSSYDCLKITVNRFNLSPPRMTPQALQADFACKPPMYLKKCRFILT